MTYLVTVILFDGSSYLIYNFFICKLNNFNPFAIFKRTYHVCTCLYLFSGFFWFTWHLDQTLGEARYCIACRLYFESCWLCLRSCTYSSGFSIGSQHRLTNKLHQTWSAILHLPPCNKIQLQGKIAYMCFFCLLSQNEKAKVKPNKTNPLFYLDIFLVTARSDLRCIT